MGAVSKVGVEALRVFCKAFFYNLVRSCSASVACLSVFFSFGVKLWMPES